MAPSLLTFAFCTYNRAARLPALVAAMRAQRCPIPFELLAVNNNSKDNTLEVLAKLASEPGVPLRYVTEPRQGIVSARNRALEEGLSADIFVFIDDDELPEPGLLDAAFQSIAVDGAHCAGGRVMVDFEGRRRPDWLDDELLGFLAAVDYGPLPFWIKDDATPVWTANIAYDMHVFRREPGLRFDRRFDRTGTPIGGGEDAAMFREFLERGLRIRYQPGMATRHFVEDFRLKRRYFLELHHLAGIRRGQYQLPDFSRRIFGFPPFLLGQLLRQLALTGQHAIARKPGLIRQAMNAAYALGMIRGYRRRGSSQSTANS